jgi:hypothetical protein
MTKLNALKNLLGVQYTRLNMIEVNRAVLPPTLKVITK